MKKLAVVWLVLFSGMVFAAGYEPQRPQVDNEKFAKLSLRAAYTAFIGDACNIPHSIPDQIRKTIKLAYSTSEEQQQLIEKFSQSKSFFTNDAQFLGILKRCYFELGKTRSLVSDVGRELEDYYQATSSQFTEYEQQHAKWQRQVEQERAEYERKQKELADIEKAKKQQERYEEEAKKREERYAEESKKTEEIRLRALKTAEQLGKLAVEYAYGGGRNIGVNLIEQEYFESETTYKLKVELTWNSNNDCESGTASVTGVITAVFDGSAKWELGKNYSWNPTSQSGALDGWLAKRRDPRVQMLKGLAERYGVCP